MSDLKEMARLLGPFGPLANAVPPAAPAFDPRACPLCGGSGVVPELGQVDPDTGGAKMLLCPVRWGGCNGTGLRAGGGA